MRYDIDMALRPTMVQLPEDLVNRLDRRAAREGVSRSRLIRDALSGYLAADADNAVAEQYEAGYSRTPFGAPDEWGDLETFHDVLARERRRATRA